MENFRRESLQDKYITLIEEKKQELDELKQQAEAILSRPGSMGERISFQSLENSAGKWFFQQEHIYFSSDLSIQLLFNNVHRFLPLVVEKSKNIKQVNAE